MSNNDKKYFIIEETNYSHVPTRYDIYQDKFFDLETALRKMLALDTLNDDREGKKYHLQEVSFFEKKDHPDLAEFRTNGASANE